MPVQRYKYIILGIFLFLILISSMGQFVASPLAPFLIEKMGLSKTQVGFLTSAVFWGTTGFGVVSGLAADKLGEERMILAGTGIIAVSLLFFSFSATFLFFLACSFFIGAGYSTAVTLTNRGLAVLFPPGEKAFAIGMKQGGMPLGVALGAFLIPLAATVFSWELAVRYLALLVLLCGIICFAAYNKLPLPREQQDTPPETAAASPRPGSNEDFNHNGYLDLLAGRQMQSLLLLGVGFIIIQSVFITFTIPYLQEALSLSVVKAGQYVALFQLSGAVSRPVCGIAGDRAFQGRREYTLFAMALLIAAFTWALSLVNPAFPWWLVVLIIVPAGFAALGWYGIHFALLSEIAGPGAAGRAIGLGVTVNCLGISIGNPLFGYIVDRTGEFSLGYQVFAAVLLVDALLFLVVFRSGKRKEPESSYNN